MCGVVHTRYTHIAVVNFTFRHVKIYDVTSYQPVHSLDYPSAILSLGVSVS